MNETLERVEKERRAERESFLGPHSLSVIPTLLQHYAPQGMEILALGSHTPVRVDERGMVHFKDPVIALVREKADIHRSNLPKKVVGVTLNVNGVNGNFFVPLITEQHSDLYARFRRYMNELVRDPKWRERPLPGKGLDVRLTESEASMWDRWIRTELDRNPERDVQWREQSL